MRRLKPAHIIAGIDVIPLVSVMFALLIPFMVVAPLMCRCSSLTLPAAASSIILPDASREDAVVVAISPNGAFFLSPGNVRFDLASLPRQVSSLLKARADKTVYVRADARAKYQAVEDVIDGLHAAGVTQMGLITISRSNL